MNADDQRLHIFFVRHRAPWWRPDTMLIHLLMGVPNHVNTGVCGRVYVVQPGKGTCIDMPLAAYAAMDHPMVVPIAHLSAEVMDPVRAYTAAENFAVGPMTRRRSVIRAFLGRADPLDVDCVSAAVIVTNAAGHWCPCPRTPKGLLSWLSSHPAFSRSLNSPASSLCRERPRKRPSLWHSVTLMLRLSRPSTTR